MSKLTRGGDSAGIAAALAAARTGMKVILVERHRFLGEVATAAGVNGLGGWHYDVDGQPLIRGIPMVQELREKLRETRANIGPAL